MAAAQRPARSGADPGDAEHTRVPKLVPVRYARMLASPFTFLRGSAAVMADDLSGTPVSGMQVAACGDMHVSNFGVYASAERNLIFAINDFDEVHPGPWEWDLKRLAASAAVAARFMGGDKAQAEAAARECVRSYRKRMRRYAAMGYLQVWYERIDERAVLDAISPRLRRNAERVMDKARRKGHVQALDKLTEEVDGEHRFVEDVPLIVRETHPTPACRRGGARPDAAWLSRLAEPRPPGAAVALSHRRRRAQGGGRGQRRHQLLGDPAAGRRRRRSAVPAGQAGAAVGAGALRLDQAPFPNQGRRVVVGQRSPRARPTSSWAGARSRAGISTSASSPT